MSTGALALVPVHVVAVHVVVRVYGRGGNPPEVLAKLKEQHHVEARDPMIECRVPAHEPRERLCVAPHLHMLVELRWMCQTHDVTSKM